MLPAEPAMFRCEVCNRRYTWTPDRANQTLTCQCGEPLSVPPKPENDLYDFAPQSPVSERPVTMRAPESCVLAYQRPEVLPGRAEANPLIVSVRDDLVIPITLILVGTVAEFISVYQALVKPMPPGVKFGIASTAVGAAFTYDVVILLIGVIAAASLLSVTFGRLPTAILKLGAIAIGPAGLGTLAAWIIGAGVLGIVIGYGLSLFVYVCLFYMLFDLDVNEIYQTVIIIYGIRVFIGISWYLLLR